MSSASVTPAQPASFVPGEFLVRFSAQTSKDSSASALRKASLKPLHAFSAVPGLYLVSGRTSQSAGQLKQALTRGAGVEYIEPNFIYRAHAVPNDPEYASRLWALNNTGQTGGGSSPYFPDIRAESAWDITTGADDLVVAVVDTGVDYNHDDLRANIFRNESECTANGLDEDGNGHIDDCHGIDVADDDSDPMDGEEHGTHVAGTIGAVGDNGIGITGVAWRVKIMPCRYLDSNGEGTTSGALRCLDYIAAMKDRGVNIVASNNSWGGFENSRALEDAIRAHRQRGILFVAAAGNSSVDVDVMPEFPCAYDLSNILCVAATYESIEIFSNYGRGTVHLGAPGTVIYSTVPGNRYDWMAGTSMASPHVAGALVLLKQQDRGRDWRALKNLVLAGAAPPREYGIPTVTGGRLDVHRSMTCADSVKLARLRPAVFEELHRPIGGRVVIRALHIRCASPDGDVAVQVSPGGELVTLRDDGAGDDDVAGDGVYSGAWIAQLPGSYTVTFPLPETASFTVRVDEQLEPGFPISADSRTFDNTELFQPLGDIAVGNIDDDPKLEIISAVPQFGPVHAWNSNGMPMPGWPIYGEAEAAGLSLGEFDGDHGKLEVAIHYLFEHVAAVRGDGSEIARSPPLSLGTIAPTPMLVDLDGDGIDEIVGGFAHRLDGSLFRSDVDVPALPTGMNGVAHGVVAADLDADGSLDFVAPSTTGNSGSLWISDVRGRHDGFPVPIPGSASLAGISHPLIGDVDGDGAPEIVLKSNNLGAPYGAQLQIYDRRGQLERTIFTNAGEGGPPTLADVNSDGIPEIVMATWAGVSVWNGLGNLMPGFPISISTGVLANQHPAVGDVDGDGQVDIVLGGFLDGPTRRLLLHAWRNDGTSIPGFPKFFDGTWATQHPVGIADIDLDGRNEIILVNIAGLGSRQSVFVYDLHGAGPYGPVEWQQKLGSTRRTGYYETGKNLAGHAFVAAYAVGPGTIRSADGGINCIGDCLQRYAKGTSVVLTATPSGDGVFAGWRGACAGQGNPCTLTVNRFRELSVDFRRTDVFTLEVTQSGAGTAVYRSNPSGIDCAGPCSGRFAPASVVDLSITPASDSYIAGINYPGCSTEQPVCRVTMTTHQTVPVVTALKPRVTLSVTGGGAIRSQLPPINCATNCTVPVAPGYVTFQAVPDPGWAFARWVNQCEANGGAVSCTPYITSDLAIAAVFEPLPRLTLDFNGSGSGSVQSPAGVSCSADCVTGLYVPQTVVLTATPAANSEFAGWSGACSGLVVTCAVQFSQATQVGVTFNSTLPPPPPPPPPPPSNGKGGGGSMTILDLAALAMLLAAILFARGTGSNSVFKSSRADSGHPSERR